MTRWWLVATCAAGLALAAPAAAQTTPTVEWGGRLHAHVRLAPGGEATFLLRRARLEATVTVMPGLTVVLGPVT